MTVVAAPVIALVDDDEPVRVALQAQLEAAGYDVLAYASGEAFLAATERADCVVTDLRMPGIGGLDLLRRVKARRPRYPVVLISGQFDERTRAEARTLGAAILDKPVYPAALSAALVSAQGC